MKYFLILFSLFLLTSCGESNYDKQKRERREKRQEMVKDAMKTLDDIEEVRINITEDLDEIIKDVVIKDNSNTTVIHMKMSDYEWDTLTLDGNILTINDMFTIKAKSEGGHIIYNLYKHDNFTGNWTQHEDWVTEDDPMKSIVNALLNDYGKIKAGDKQAFKFK